MEIVTRALLATTFVAAAATGPFAQRGAPQPPATPRLYVIDCGKLEGGDPARYELTRQELATTDMSVGCYLVTHPRGALFWDAGAVPDADVQSASLPVRHRLVLPNGQERFVTISKTLAAQLASTGYRPADVTHVALSHYHYDHTANANLFASATWLVRKAERDAMFAEKPTDLTRPSTYASLKASRTTNITADDHDVFGDGSVVLKLAAGHTPGHQVLFVKLAKTGPVVLSGDLYHYPEERALKRIPVFEIDKDATRGARASLDRFLQSAGAQLWIQHDIRAFTGLKKAPEFYD
jgi:glyoxylase-like metal-dependent hydrolase (beta-lactamase superfamily II)